MDQLLTGIEYIARGIEYAGVLIVAGAAVGALFALAARHTAPAVIRRKFAEWIMTGLEFIIAAEIILATIISGREEILLLGAVVVIRILLGYALKKEIT